MKKKKLEKKKLEKVTGGLNEEIDFNHFKWKPLFDNSKDKEK